MAGGAIATFLNDVAGGFFGNDYLRDYTHASKTFRAANYQNAPKFKFLFHVYFDINAPDVYGSIDALKGKNFGLLVKTVKLPNFNVESHVYNQYNRKRIVQTKIKYDPIDITFHDDNKNLITGLWYKYYTYHYKDAVKAEAQFNSSRGGAQIKGNANTVGTNPTLASYNTRTTYVPSISGNEDWGYIGDSSQPTNASGVKSPFFKNITIFGFNQHNFIAYTLINPIITRFNHDSYSYNDGGGTMENSMSVDYETVLYNQGSLDGNKPENIVNGFGSQENYDRRASPITIPGSNSNILGPSGVIAGVGGTISALSGTDPNYLQALKLAGTTINSIKNVNLNTITSEVKQNIQNALLTSGNTTRNTKIDIPEWTPTNSVGNSTSNSLPLTSIGQVSDRLVTAGKQLTNIVTGPNSPFSLFPKGNQNNNG